MKLADVTNLLAGAWRPPARPVAKVRCRTHSYVAVIIDGAVLGRVHRRPCCAAWGLEVASVGRGGEA